MNSKKNSNNSGFFGPLLLIALGTFWLLSNFGILPDLNWGALLNLWPLLLIFLGLNMVVGNAPGILGKLLSTLVTLAAVGTLMIVLVFADSLPFINSSGNATAIQDEPVRVPLGDAESAQIRIDMGSTKSNLFVLDDSEQLIDGTVSYFGMLDLQVSERRDGMSVDLNTVDSGWHFGSRSNSLNPWELGLSDDVPVDLRIDAGSGSVEMLLSGMELSNFDVDAGSGGIYATLPEGAYDVNIDLGSGASTWVLPGSGNGEYTIDGGSGGMKLLVPQSIEARVEVDGGSGGFSADSRFIQTSAGDNSVWETANYDNAENKIEIQIDQGSGSVTIELPSGR